MYKQRLRISYVIDSYLKYMPCHYLCSIYLLRSHIHAFQIAITSRPVTITIYMYIYKLRVICEHVSWTDEAVGNLVEYSTLHID